MSEKNKTMKKEQKPILDELIEKKFPSEKDRTPENITKFLNDLLGELNDLQPDDDSDDEKDDDERAPDGFIGRLKQDDFPDNVIPFVVVKKDSLFLDYKCPYCGMEDKYSMKKFDKSPYDSHECPECKKEFLVKLDFEPELKIYSEVKNG